MSNLAIIPARSGSKRIPDKNIRNFEGKPIIAYSIGTALNCNLFDEVMVSTDSAEIAAIAQKWGASVPFLRSKENSDNYATLADVIIEVVSNYNNQGRFFNLVCCILPTSALINRERLEEAYRIFCERGYDSLIPVMRFSYPIQRALKEADGLLKFREPENIQTRSQDLETFYHDSGQFYWIRADSILNERSIFTSNTGFIELADFEAQDVDTFTDWEMLELKYKYLKKKYGI